MIAADIRADGQGELLTATVGIYGDERVVLRLMVRSPGGLFRCYANCARRVVQCAKRSVEVAVNEQHDAARSLDHSYLETRASLFGLVFGDDLQIVFQQEFFRKSQTRKSNDRHKDGRAEGECITGTVLTEPIIRIGRQHRAR